jgi:hypothetical protein
MRLHPVLLIVIALCAGCAFTPLLPRGNLPLSPFKPSIESATLEVAFIRHPLEQSAFNDDLWYLVDETQLPHGVRRELDENGLRAGVLSGEPPASIAALLSDDGAGASSNAYRSDDAETSPAISAAKLEHQPLCRRRTLHLQRGQRSEILASGVYDRLPLLLREDGQVRGDNYTQAQGLFALKVFPEGDGRVRLQLTPELHHGPQQQQYVPDDGVIRLQSSRAKRSFDKLAVDVTLSPGQCLVLGTRPSREGSIGYRFFTEAHAGQLDQKLLLIRLDGSRFDNLLVTERGAGDESEMSGGD